MKTLNLKFSYCPVTYGEIKSGIGEQWNTDTEVYKWLCQSKECDKRIGDTIVRLGQPEKLFNHKIWWECNVPQTVAAAGTNSRGKEHTFVSTEDIIHSQTFPEDYRFTIGGGAKRNFSANSTICMWYVGAAIDGKTCCRQTD